MISPRSYVVHAGPVAALTRSTKTSEFVSVCSCLIMWLKHVEFAILSMGVGNFDSPKAARKKHLPNYIAGFTEPVVPLSRFFRNEARNKKWKRTMS